SRSAVPSRHSIVRQARLGRPRASALTEIGRWLASRRISFGGRPRPDHFFGGNGPVPSGGQLHSGEKISGEFVITCGDGTEVFELIEDRFDKVAFAVDRKIARSRGLAVGFRRDHRSDSPLG